MTIHRIKPKDIYPNNTPKQASIQSESFLPQHWIPLDKKTQNLVEPNFWKTIEKSSNLEFP
jgi:hypothetical protein